MTPKILVGDVLDVLPLLADASIDAVVCDPPYALGFMGHAWDTHTPRGFQLWCQAWATECLRVLKPGGHLLAFGGTRTVHRLTSGIEDAGLEIRDGIDWLYGSGFPKSLDVSKAIDRTRDDRADVLAVTSWLADHADRALITRADVDAYMSTSDMAGWWLSRLGHRCSLPTLTQWDRLRSLIGFGPDMDAEVLRLNLRKGEPGEAWAGRPVAEHITRPGMAESWTGGVGWTGTATRGGGGVLADAQRWEGWGTALKPAREPIVVARKPLAGTVAANVQAYGTGALNIDACRVPGTSENASRDKGHGMGYGGANGSRGAWTGDNGRWPTNVIMSHAGDEDTGDACADGCVPGCAVAVLDASAGPTGAKAPVRGTETSAAVAAGGVTNPRGRVAGAYHADGGGPSRFYPVFRYQAKAPARERPKVDGVSHSTVKPLALMRWLVRLVCPPGGHVLDPFAGSGTTVEACLLEGFDVTAVEKHEPYLPLIAARIARTARTA